MSETIKASEITPGMKILWEVDDSVIQTYAKAVKRVERGARMEITTRTDAFWYIRADIPVTVLAEPQPEEPTKPGSKVSVNGENFLQCVGYWLNIENNTVHHWDKLCERGTVTIIDSDPSWDKTQ